MDDSGATLEPTDDDRGKGALQLTAVVYAGRAKWEGAIRLRSFETARDAMQLALRSASVSDDRIFTVRRLMMWDDDDVTSYMFLFFFFFFFFIFVLVCLV